MIPLGGERAMLNDLYWGPSYARPDRLDEAEALAVNRWGAARRQVVYEWAKNSSDPDIRAAAEKLGPARRPGKNLPAPALWPTTASERTLFYRRVLAAWTFLLAVHEETVLTKLHQLIALENTPLP